MNVDTLQPILLVEDDPADAKLLIRKFGRAGVLNPITHLSDGDEALAYLSGIDQYSDRVKHPLPVLVILDLKIPGITGLELLRVIRKRRDLRPIPIVILTAEENEAIIRGAYELGANSYLVKSADETRVLEMAVAIRDYWLKLNRTAALAIAGEAGI